MNPAERRYLSALGHAVELLLNRVPTEGAKELLLSIKAATRAYELGNNATRFLCLSILYKDGQRLFLPMRWNNTHEGERSPGFMWCPDKQEWLFSHQYVHGFWGGMPWPDNAMDNLLDHTGIDPATDID